MDKIKFKEVFSGTLWEATIIKNILEDNGLQVFIENNLMSTIAPYIVTAGGSNSTKILTSETDYDPAIKLIEEYNKAVF